MSKLPKSSLTLRDVAKAMGISHSTVSRALRNFPQIPEAHRLEIQATAERMGFQLNAAAAALSHRRNNSTPKPVSGVIAWLNFWPDPERLRGYKEFEQYWLGASAAAEKFGYHLEEFVCSDSMPLSRLGAIFLARGVNAILLPPIRGNEPDMDRLNWSRFSGIRFGRSISFPAYHVVAADQVANTLMAFEKIQSRGYERIGWVNWHKREELGRMFKAGFLLAQSRLEEAFRVPALTLRPELPNESLKSLKHWLKTEKPDAILTEMAEIPAMLQKCGYRVPDDIGLAVNSILDGNADSGIDQNSFEVGRVAVLTLISLVHDNDRGLPPIHRELLIKGDWINGATLPFRRKPKRQ